MPDRPLKLRDLRRILRCYGAQEAPGRGKGSHTMFWKKFPDKNARFFVPTHGSEVAQVYVRKLRMELRLTLADGVSDEAFYSG